MKMTFKLLHSAQTYVLWVFILFPVLSTGFLSQRLLFRANTKDLKAQTPILMDARDELSDGPFYEILKKKGFHPVDVGPRALTNLPAFFNEVMAYLKPVLENNDSFLSNDYPHISSEEPIQPPQTEDEFVLDEPDLGQPEIPVVPGNLEHYKQHIQHNVNYAQPQQQPLVQQDRNVEVSSDGLDYPFAGDFNSCWHRMLFRKRAASHNKK